MAGATTRTLTRAQALKYRAIAQVAACVGLLAAGGVLAMSIVQGPSTAVRSAKIEAPPVDAAKFVPPADIGQVKADIDGIASRMMLVSNSPKIADAPKVDTSAPPPPPPFSLRDHIKFLGVVSEGTSMLALVAIDGKQHIVAVGDVLKLMGDQTATVDEITADAVRVTADKKQESIEIAHRAVAAVSHGAAAPVAARTDPARPDGLKGADPRTRKDAKELVGLRARNDAMNEENRSRSERLQREQREVQRKAVRSILEQESGRSGDEIEKTLDQLEQSGKLGEKIDSFKKEKSPK